MTEAEFKPIPGYPNHLVSRDGRVVRRDGYSVSQHVVRKGYIRINLGARKSTGLHRAVALAWIPNPHKYPQVNHIDGNKANNDVSNLEWASNEMNIRHAFEAGLHPRPPTPVLGVNPDTGETVWAKSQHAAGGLGFSYRRVNACLRRPDWRHKGFFWSYA